MIVYLLLFFLSVLSFIMCENFLFKDLPPSVVFFSSNGGGLPLILTCKTQSLRATIRMYSTYKNITGVDSGRDIVIVTSKKFDIEYHYDGGVSIVVRTAFQAKTLDMLYFHCLASTITGSTVVSRPFQVQEAYIGLFPNVSDVPIFRKLVVSFLYGNVAYVHCQPPLSVPHAVVKVMFNGTYVEDCGRHRYVRRPGHRTVTLLISPLESSDQGDYRCVATNTVTGETRLDSLVQQLRMKSNDKTGPVSIRLSISGRDLAIDGLGVQPVEVLSLREGSDTALFCVIEGASPTQVSTSKLKRVHDRRNRHVTDHRFGLLSITDLGPEDEGLYSCRGGGVRDMVRLKVERRLHIDRGPRDILIDHLGVRANFSCFSNKDGVIPYWYFNGKLRLASTRSSRGSSLVVPNVQKEDLGVYQCVVHWKDEWLTHLARLDVKGDTKSHRRGRLYRREIPLTKGSKIGYNIKRERLLPPLVYIIDDNLAVLLQWHQYDGVNDVTAYLYGVQYRYRKSQTEDWSSVNTLQQEIADEHLYVTSRHLHAQYLYLFRIFMTMRIPPLAGSATRYSAWSRQISFIHIYPVQPTVQLPQPHNDSHVRIKWQYASSSDFPINNYHILVRKMVHDGPRVLYSKYSLFRIDSAEATDALVGPLAGGSRYQVVVYGVQDSVPRRITLYSADVHVETVPSDTASVSLWPRSSNSESNTRLMFVILGSLATLMLLVIALLVLMCYCRERRSLSLHAPSRRKEPYLSVHASEQAKAVKSSFLLASIGAAASANAHSVGRESEQPCSPDSTYCQEKREPPSGGSWHDRSDSERDSSRDECETRESTADRRHLSHVTGVLTPHLPSVTYYKVGPGPASLPSGSLLRHQVRPTLHFVPQGQLADNYVQTEFDSRSQDGRDWHYFSHPSRSAAAAGGGGGGGGGGLMHRTVDTGSQTVHSSDVSAGHRHRRKRRKTSNSASSVNGAAQTRRAGQRDVVHDVFTPRESSPGTVGVGSAEQYWGPVNGTLGRRGTPTLFVEPPRIRDYSEYGIQPQQSAHLSQQNLNLHNQHYGGYREAQA